MQIFTKLRLAALVVSATVLAGVGTGLADEGNPVLRTTLGSAYVGEPLAVGSPNAGEAIAAIVWAAGEIPGEVGPWLLPADTVVDRATWVENVLEIYLTVPGGLDDWYLSPLDQESIGRALGSPFAEDPWFGGTRLRVRVGENAPYGTLEQFLLPKSTPTVEVEEPDEGAFPAKPLGDSGVRSERGLGGPTVQAGRQPIGALTGVTVFASAGHGWTAGDASWYLQRPVLLDMCEDYGNIDQLNYFVHYAFNAGATVVPFRPVGWQPLEIVLDNDDPGVTFTGTWTNGTSAKYYENGTTMSGIVYKWTEASPTETATARYTPTIPETGFYPVFCFTIASSNRSLQTYRVSHSGGISSIAIDHRQVGNGWIWLGSYYLEADGDNYVEITNESDDGYAIIADAIRWGGGFGDIVRPGPGSISGFSRDEECQKYWAQSELGNNAVGFDSDIWDISGADDGSDNVRVGAKWAREMNQEPAGGVLVDRWKRIHLEFHTNASGGSARGQICLITDLGATTYQVEYANILSDEVDADMLVLDDEFEHPWVDRDSATYTSSYGAICTPANGDEFDATIVELAFHDNPLDTDLLRDSGVRAAMARSCLHGIIRFLNTLPDSEVPLAFAPDTPRYVRAEDLGGGDVLISWEPPLSDGARGDPATGYVVYQSTNGYGFGSPVVVGDVLSATISDVPADETRYFRVAATNAGGESMPSEVLAVRRPSTGAPEVLIVNGFDRLRRQINPIQTFTQPPAYAGDWIERQIWSRSNSFDYVVQHAEALAAHGVSFVSCSNEAIIDSYIRLEDHEIVIWILGTESTEDSTFTSNERTKVTNFLLRGGALFVSGSEVGFDLITHGASFLQGTLGAGYVADDAGTYEFTGSAGGYFSDLGPFDFDPAQGTPYDVRTPDVLAAQPEAQACFDYVGGAGGVAGVEYQAGIYNVVTFGFPFEAISSESAREMVMGRVIEFLRLPHGALPFDYNSDYDVDFQDFTTLLWCFQGPDTFYPDGHTCVDVAGEDDLDIDLADFSVLQRSFTGPDGP